ncbi:hypothetical protein cypCar_00002251 [Cyprinus carpio]|nr:hypothetical protein cypCar_00002251 [Cyprinus carpio]
MVQRYSVMLIKGPGGQKRDQSPAEKCLVDSFAYAGLCGVSLGQLFQGSEQKNMFECSDTFLSILHAEPLLRAGALPITQDLVSFSVKDVYTVFQIIMQVTYQKDFGTIKSQIFVCVVFHFVLDNWYQSQTGHYDARARVLIRHVSCLLHVTQQQLEDSEETLGEKLREAGEENSFMGFWGAYQDVKHTLLLLEESSRRQKKERGRKLRRFLLTGLATVGGGTVIGIVTALTCPASLLAVASVITTPGECA